jgi:hypothetical protein
VWLDEVVWFYVIVVGLLVILLGSVDPIAASGGKCRESDGNEEDNDQGTARVDEIPAYSTPLGHREGCSYGQSHEDARRQ